MKNINKKDIIIPTVALLLICLVSTALLAFTNSITAEKIALNAIETEQNSRALVLPGVASCDEVVTHDSGVTYCLAKDNIGNDIGYVFTSSAKGYGGSVIIMVGMDMEGKITGMEILSHSETPGLGANAVKPDFKSRFLGKSGELTVSKTDNSGQNIQAITAATITSKAVTSAVNSAVAVYEEITGGAK